MKFVKSKTILVDNELNMYKGCEFGCIYCETKAKCKNNDIEVKENSLELLEEQLKKKKPCMIKIGTLYDPYQPIEKDLNYTKKALELIKKYKFGVAIYTKSNLILKDLDLIAEINKITKAVVIVSFSTYRDMLCSLIEPKVSVTKERVEILSICKQKEIPAIMAIDPVLPYITDNNQNIERLLDYAAKTQVKGVICNGMGMTLRNTYRKSFYKKLDESFPRVKEKYEMVYNNTELCISLQNNDLTNLFNLICIEKNIENDINKLNDFINILEEDQLSIFDFIEKN